MLDLIEKIGPFVGLAAFIGLAVLAFVIFQQSRDVRRLREWAGRAPERASEAADASSAAAEARGEGIEEEKGPSRIAALRERIAEVAGPRLRSVDRQLPVDGRIVLGIAAAAVVAAAVLTSGFGLVGDDEGGKAERREQRQPKPEVAILNATQQGGVQGVPGLAMKVADQVVKPAGYKITAQTNAPTGFTESVVMYVPRAEGAAAEFARAIESKLGSTRLEPIAPDVRQQSNDADVVLLIGADDSDF